MPWRQKGVDASEIRRAPVEVVTLSHYFEDFIHPGWCRISSITSMVIAFDVHIFNLLFWCKLWTTAAVKPSKSGRLSQMQKFDFARHMIPAAAGFAGFFQEHVYNHFKPRFFSWTVVSCCFFVGSTP